MAILSAGGLSVVKEIDYLAILSVIALITTVAAHFVRMYVQLKANRRAEKDHAHKEAERKRANLKQAVTICDRRKDDRRRK